MKLFDTHFHYSTEDTPAGQENESDKQTETSPENEQ